MDNKSTERTRRILDLIDHVNAIGSDRPSIGVFLQALNIDPKVMSDTVETTALAAKDMRDHAAIEMTNILFKLGVTIGYKYAIKKQMEEQFGRLDGANNVQ